jgi:hypothetical protein
METTCRLDWVQYNLVEQTGSGVRALKGKVTKGAEMVKLRSGE